MAPGQRFGEIAAHIPAGLPQFFQYVTDGRFTRLEDRCQFRGRVHLETALQILQTGRVFQIFQCKSVLVYDFSGQIIGFRMDGRIIQRLGAVFDAQKAGTLGECRRAQAVYVHQFLTVVERAVFVAIGDDIGRCCRGQAGYMLQQGG